MTKQGTLLLPADLGNRCTFHLYGICAEIFCARLLFLASEPTKHIPGYDCSRDDAWMSLTLRGLKWVEFNTLQSGFCYLQEFRISGKERWDFVVPLTGFLTPKFSISADSSLPKSC